MHTDQGKLGFQDYFVRYRCEPRVRELVYEGADTAGPKIAISPIIGGAAVKGPAAKIMQELEMEVSPFGVASHLEHILTGFVLDTVDQVQQARIESLGLATACTDTLMRSRQDQARLAREIVEFGLRQ